jgi:zinc transport system permease protein
MAVIAAGLAALSALAGLQGSYMFDTPTGPTIVCMAAILFALSTLPALVQRRRAR